MLATFAKLIKIIFTIKFSVYEDNQTYVINSFIFKMLMNEVNCSLVDESCISSWTIDN